jgi:hypothetical protein
MDKFVIRERVASRSPSPVRQIKPFYLGILGSRNDMNLEDLYTKVIEPLVETHGKYPEKIIMPSEGSSNIYIGGWAEKEKIPSAQYYSDWKRDGKRARILRDNKILTEATHIVCVNGPRSEYYEKLGARWLKKKSGIFVLDFPTQELAQLE